MERLRELYPNSQSVYAADVTMIQLIRLANYFKDPASYGQRTQEVLRATAKRYQDALDDCEIQIVSSGADFLAASPDKEQAGSEVVSRTSTRHESSPSNTNSLRERDDGQQEET